MIGKTLVFLRKQLDDYLRSGAGGSGDDPAADRVVFLDGDKMDPIAFPSGTVSQLLVNVEEERLLRPAERFARLDADGKLRHAQPDIHLVLYVLFVARFKQYDAAWDQLARIVEYLQAHPSFEPAAFPSMPAGMERLALELLTMNFAQQNEMWSALRAAYHPSLLFRANLLVMRDASPTAQDQITEAHVNVRRIP